jgi:rsbT co-antagonist protein RsbR
VPRFVPPDPSGMKDFWAVYDAHFDQLNKHLLELVNQLPGLAALVRRMTPQQMDQQNAENRRLLEGAALRGEWEPFLQSQRQQGPTYAAMGIGFTEWFDLISGFHKYLLPMLVDAYIKDPKRLAEVLTATNQYIDLSMGIIGEEYLKAKEKIISQQSEAIQELSTPVLVVRERLLLIPIVGLLDTHRARHLTESLLHAVREHRAKVVVIDITGVAAVDSKVANHLFQTVAAAQLMGAQSIVTGLTADVAQALVVLGIDVNKLYTAGDLQGGLEEAERMLKPGRVENGDARSNPQAG